ncbi:hypothetical protein KRR38_34115 [Novosphingobium sp. G106]|uniref:hypothetical protein n=1 Tax=Novosphingobium sp. G106 TaxID=2849500 RepID=UPI001C2D46C4|nr:hypothetical protein [Novosphingobium sp. G106]MBV1692535.1 hypothetical protein [Novosphingobium sp. G106]
MSDMAKNMLAQSRAYGTTEEREVLALESIADQLRLLVELGTRAANSEVSRGTEEVGRADVADERAWENEGGSLDKGLAASLDIKHSATAQFETGGYRYTKLADAIAQAKRARDSSLS